MILTITPCLHSYLSSPVQSHLVVHFTLYFVLGHDDLRVLLVERLSHAARSFVISLNPRPPQSE